MSLIFGKISWQNEEDKSQVALLKKDLENYPSDELDEYSEDNFKAGLFSIRLRKHPFPQEKIIQGKELILVADARLDYRDELVEKLALGRNSLIECSDSELIYKAYERWGESCVDYLEGDFVFLIYNTQTKKIWGARDPIGLRPLFFIQHESDFFFSTSIKGLLELKLFPNEINETFWINRLLNLKCEPFETPHKNIFSIPIGCTIIADVKSFKTKTFYVWKRKVVKKTSEEYEFELKELLRKAVHTRMYPDYEIGVMLSGGLDSSAVSAIAYDKLEQIDPSKKLWTASSVAEEGQSRARDERPWVNLFQSRFPNIHTAFFTSKNLDKYDKQFKLFAFVRYRRLSALQIDQKIYQHFEKNECKTILTGWRGDHFISRHSYHALNELMFSGNILFFIKNLKKVTKWRNVSALRLFRKILKSNKPPTYFKNQNLSFLKEHIIEKCQLEIDNRNRINGKSKLRGVEEDFKSRFPDNIIDSQFYTEDITFLNKKSSYKLHPLSDKRVIEFALNLPAIELEKEGIDRSLFRRSLKHILPDELRMRPDKGYFNYNERKLLKMMIVDVIENKLEIIKKSPFNSFVDVDNVILALKQYLKSDATKFKIDYKFVDALNIVGYLLYFSEED